MLHFIYKYFLCIRMTINTILSKKSDNKNKIKKLLGIRSKSRALGCICSSIDVTDDFLEWLSFCDADFVVFKDISEMKKYDNIYHVFQEDVQKTLSGFDFFICNGETKDIQGLLKEGVIPIVYKKNYLSSLLQEFNPIKWEGNCFLFDSENKWSMYASVVKYLENYKFPYDNKNLVKNTVQI